ncbi:avidin-related protein 1-like [Protobothrops mucrosquamatus]|uniref:avidin-related protein 1-like n=1 Tax=Protobothrops mucrosquamatus TaxID=103944 RepID=UPI000775DF97|nr:avidin-related protein 1-like [Protobothrops mucrosquamatus]
MAIGLAALGLLAFLLGCSGTFAEPQNSKSRVKCSLTGRWEDDRGYSMEIDSVSDTGLFRGTFYFDTTLMPYMFSNPLLGIQHQGLPPIFGFAVLYDSEIVQFLLWNRRHVTGPRAVFVGLCLVDWKGKEQLRTTWLRREPPESEGKDWGAAWAGSSIFYRTEW